ITALAVGGLLLTANQPDESALPEAEVLTDAGVLKWFKGNIHTHTLWSDGDDYPEMVALWYREQGYDFLSFSDHNTLFDHERWTDALGNPGGRVALDKLKARFPEGWIEERLSAKGALEVRLKTFPEISRRIAEPGRFLLIQGEEISD